MKQIVDDVASLASYLCGDECSPKQAQKADGLALERIFLGKVALFLDFKLRYSDNSVDIVDIKSILVGILPNVVRILLIILQLALIAIPNGHDFEGIMSTDSGLHLCSRQREPRVGPTPRSPGLALLRLLSTPKRVQTTTS